MGMGLYTLRARFKFILPSYVADKYNQFYLYVPPNPRRVKDPVELKDTALSLAYPFPLDEFPEFPLFVTSPQKFDSHTSNTEQRLNDLLLEETLKLDNEISSK